MAEGMAHALLNAAVGGEPLGGVGEVAPLALGQRDDSPGRAPPAFDLGDRIAVSVDEDELGRAAGAAGAGAGGAPADVEDEGGAVARLEQAVAAEHRQPRFLLGGDDL